MDRSDARSGNRSAEPMEARSVERESMEEESIEESEESPGSDEVDRSRMREIMARVNRALRGR